jgi:hypothetical protein
MIFPSAFGVFMFNLIDIRLRNCRMSIVIDLQFNKLHLINLMCYVIMFPDDIDPPLFEYVQNLTNFQRIYYMISIIGHLYTKYDQLTCCITNT